MKGDYCLIMLKRKDIFTEIKPNDNEMLCMLNNKDLKYVLSLINTYKLLLRERINVDEQQTFGLEIECENAKWDKIQRRMINDWVLSDDLSLLDGAEIKSPPLRDTLSNWITLRNMCSMISKYSDIGINSGGHVHVGIQALGNNKQSLINFLKLWASYEHVIYRFSYGEFIGPRPGIKEAAKSVQVKFNNLCYLYEKKYISDDDLIYHLSVDKCESVNFKHYDTIRTIEFRCPNATLNPVVWQNNVNLFLKMMLYSNSNKFNYQTINEKRQELFVDSKSPNQIYVNDAIEFADLVFDNNLDKIYFLRQYLKSFEVSNEYEMAKSFC